MILAVRTQILVYYTATSLLLRSLRIEEHDKITSYIVCGSNSSHLFISTYSGVVLKWDWTMGQELKRWKLSEKLLYIAEQGQDQKSESSSLLLIHEGSDQSRRLIRRTFVDNSDKFEESVVLEHKSLASWMKVLDEGKCLILYAANKLLLGQAVRKPEGTPIKYVWREVELPQSIISVDARAHVPYPGTKRKHLAVDIVLGCQNGSILIYDDILFKLVCKERNPSEEDIVARRFHWHRNEVLTVKWSIDGNYIISGGHETVMVIWQLDTGHQQFLPHLSSAVQHLTVSRTGAAYAVHLADNSVMILSTSELQPTAYISGLAIRRHRSNEKRVKKCPAVLGLEDSTTIAVAVPADCPARSGADPNATLLQTYDIRAQQQINRQALVRNNITALNVDPAGNTIHEPDVTHTKISYNGKWLATIDEWTPHEKERMSLQPINDDTSSYGKEIFLKFWARNDSARSWELITKIESPHSTRTTACLPILDLRSNPHRSEFSTISSNGTINIWTPKSRHRNGLPVKDKSGSQLYTWTCTYTVEIPLPFSNLHQLTSPKTTTTKPVRCSLAYSPDASVLATSSNQSPCIHFIDPTIGHIQHTQSGPHPGLFSHITFLQHHLVAVSRDLRVYNTVSGDLLYALALNPFVVDVKLAANEGDGTFTVVLGVTEERGRGKLMSQIMIFDLQHATPIFRKMIDGAVEVLLSLQDRGESGYMLVNEEAEVVYLRDKSRRGTISGKKMEETPTQQLLEGQGLKNKFEGLFAPWKSIEAVNAGRIGENSMQRVVLEGMENEGITHKTNSSLADVFNRSSNLPVRDLFEQVVGVLQGGIGREREAVEE